MEQAISNKSQKDEKREAVFAVAGDVFARYGFRRTAMNDIAQAAGISRAALYLMVENKEDLFSEVVTFRFRPLLASFGRSYIEWRSCVLGHADEAFSFYPPAHIFDWWAKEACNLYGGVEVADFRISKNIF